MSIVRWIRGKIDTYINPDPALSFLDPEVHEDEDRSEPTTSSRFRVTTKDAEGKDDRVLFVYGRDEDEARSRIPESLLVGAVVEPAGCVENGVVHFPPEELRQVMESMQDGRRAPGA